MVITLFIENLSETLHWKGLWHVFGSHGDVADPFIARKRSRGDKRFGFMRFTSRIDAERAMERLNDFFFIGKRLSVSLAKYKSRNTY
ncbi:hypothetical protein V6N13_017244 [Hibiscus sabdariffa]